MIPNLVVFLPMMSPVEPGLPHACLSPQTQHATLFSHATQRYVNLRRLSPTNNPVHTKDTQTHTCAHTNRRDPNCNTSNFCRSTKPDEPGSEPTATIRVCDREMKIYCTDNRREPEYVGFRGCPVSSRQQEKGHFYYYHNNSPSFWWATEQQVNLLSD